MSAAPRLATVAAAQQTLLFELHRDKLAGLVAQHPALGTVIERFYRDRLLATVLRASPVFRPLSEYEKAAVGDRFVRHALAPHTVVLRQGESGRGLCVILRGQCDALRETAEGEVPLRRLREGDIFGEISLLREGSATATVRTVGTCDVLELHRADFRELVLPNAQVREMIEKLASERLAHSADVLGRGPRVGHDYLV